MPKAIKLVFLSFFLLLSVGCSSFHVKVIDQHGKPVPDVKVRVGTLTNLFLVSGSKTEFFNTDDDGRFNLGGPRVGIELIHKNGYEFRDGKGFGSTTTYSNFKRGQENSYSNPYYILAWKREDPEILIGRENAKGILVIPNGKYYEIYFTNEGVFKKRLINVKPIENTNTAPTLLVRYKESNKIVRNHQNIKKHPWELTLTVPNGGLIKTNDLIRNKAPKDGYIQSWTIKSDELKNVATTVIQKFYIKSKNGRIYGHITANFASNFRSLRLTPFWLNMNGSRNLTRPKKYIYCKPRNFVPENCSVDDFGP